MNQSPPNPPTSQIWAEDVSDQPDLRAASREMAFQEYKRIYGKEVLQEEIVRTFWPAAILDGEVPYYRTLMAFERDGESAKPVATVTFRLGSLFDGEGPVLDFMKYVRPAGGWDGFSCEGFDPRRTLEVEMFAFAPDATLPDRLETRIQVFRLFHSTGMRLGKQYQCDQFWSLLAKPFARFVNIHCGLPCIRASEIELNEEEYRDFFNRLPGYWRRGKPGLYRTYPLATPTEI